MSYNVYVEDVSVEAVFNKLGGVAGAKSLLRGEVVVSELERSWHEQNDVIYFTVTSDGTTGVDWIKRLEIKGMCLSDYAKRILRSSDFKPTSGVIYEIAVLKYMLFNDNDRITKKIRAEAEQRKLSTPNAEIACLLWEKFTDEEIEDMGLTWIVVMHDPISDSDGNPCLLSAHRACAGSWLKAYWDYPDNEWYRGSGFAFVVSQVNQPCKTCGPG